jgi:hypothetical protein
MRISYRAGQFLRSVFPRLNDTDKQLVRGILHPELAGLFFSMNRADQLHSIRVLKDLIRSGQSDDDLLAAALLHDVGKSRDPLNPLQRALIVLANLVAPALVDRLGQANHARGLWKPFRSAVQHPRWGAELVEANGGSPRLAAIIRRHQEVLDGSSPNDLDPWIALLQGADNRN